MSGNCLSKPLGVAADLVQEMSRPPTENNGQELAGMPTGNHTALVTTVWGMEPESLRD